MQMGTRSDPARPLIQWKTFLFFFCGQGRNSLGSCERADVLFLAATLTNTSMLVSMSLVPPPSWEEYWGREPDEPDELG